VANAAVAKGQDWIREKTGVDVNEPPSAESVNETQASSSLSMKRTAENQARGQKAGSGLQSKLKPA
jgi:hypothetical protein